MHFDWELASWIATTLGAVFAVLGLLVVILQLHQQRTRHRLDFLFRLHSEFDTHEGRIAREYIYNAPASELRWEFLHVKDHEAERRLVEGTVAMLDRIAYQIVTKQVPDRDAYDLYSGVVLRLAYLLWPYIEDHRSQRQGSRLRHRGSHRRHLERLVLQWAPRFARQSQASSAAPNASTRDVLKQLFTE